MPRAGRRLPPRALIFDFDGVIADSEVIASAALGQFARDLGLAISDAETIRRFTGKRVSEVAVEIEREAGRSLPDFTADMERRVLAAFERDLRPVPGFREFIAQFAETPRCIASSSTGTRVRRSLDILGLTLHFGDAIVSGDQVAEPKPAPEIYLKALALTGTDADGAVAIEDSPSGVIAATSAGIPTIGLLAGSHATPELGARLADVGCVLVAQSYTEIARYLGR